MSTQHRFIPNVHAPRRRNPGNITSSVSTSTDTDTSSPFTASTSASTETSTSTTSTPSTSTDTSIETSTETSSQPTSHGTLLRVKRKRDQSPLQALLVHERCQQRLRLDDALNHMNIKHDEQEAGDTDVEREAPRGATVFKFVGTVSQVDETPTPVIMTAISKLRHHNIQRQSIKHRPTPSPHSDQSNHHHMARQTRIQAKRKQGNNIGKQDEMPPAFQQAFRVIDVAIERKQQQMRESDSAEQRRRVERERWHAEGDAERRAADVVRALARIRREQFSEQRIVDESEPTRFGMNADMATSIRNPVNAYAELLNDYLSGLEPIQSPTTNNNIHKTRHNEEQMEQHMESNDGNADDDFVFDLYHITSDDSSSAIGVPSVYLRDGIYGELVHEDPTALSDEDEEDENREDAPHTDYCDEDAFSDDDEHEPHLNHYSHHRIGAPVNHHDDEEDDLDEEPDIRRMRRNIRTGRNQGGYDSSDDDHDEYEYRGGREEYDYECD